MSFAMNDDNGSHGERSFQSVNEPLGLEHFGRIEELLSYTFEDKERLDRALTHRSVPSKGNKADYERLEFLGDAVLDLAVAQLLLDAHPDAREGELSKMRAALVNTASLASIARRMGLGAFIRLSKGELANNGSERPSILADVFEAIIGAVYREAGFEAALKSVEVLFGDAIANVTPRDPKTELQEVLHALGGMAPEYLLECVEGPEHAPTFVSVVQVDGEIVGRGRGTTKKQSQQNAAAEALKIIEEEGAEYGS
ncbi:MAG: ribonuclease III [Bdellovibrionales bacterium]|nr:ribonuclease III [Bdellovibrionales bacterium]